MLLHGQAFVMCASVQVGGRYRRDATVATYRFAPRVARLLSSGSARHCFCAHFRLVSREGIAVVKRRRASWQNARLAAVADVSRARLGWCAGRVNLTPNPAVNRTPICVTSSARSGAGAGYLIRWASGH